MEITHHMTYFRISKIKTLQLLLEQILFCSSRLNKLAFILVTVKKNIIEFVHN